MSGGAEDKENVREQKYKNTKKNINKSSKKISKSNNLNVCKISYYNSGIFSLNLD